MGREGRVSAGETARKAKEVTSQAPQAWFVMLRDEAAAGRVIVPLRPFLKFSRKMDKQLGRLEKRIRRRIPQVGRRGTGRSGRG